MSYLTYPTINAENISVVDLRWTNITTLLNKSMAFHIKAIFMTHESKKGETCLLSLASIAK